MRKKLPGIASATKKLADGTRRKYFYAWRGGPLIKAEDGTPLKPEDPRFFVAYTDAHRARKMPAQGTMFNLVALFRSSAEFTSLSDKTRKSYSRYLKMIEENHGDMPIEVVEHPKARGEFKSWRDQLADKPRTADYAWTVLARVLSVAKDRGKIARNVCERGGRLYETDRTETIWTADNIKAFCAVASTELQAALLLALWTGARQGDLLRLTWAAYDGARIRLRQGKTGKRVTIPVGAPLKAALDAAIAAGRPTTTILSNTRGKPWTEDGFRTSWGKAFDRSGLSDDLHFHDLRGTAATRLALAGCTVPQIAAITGHSMKDVESILEAHYLGGAIELAEAAIVKLNAVYG
ncbi:MAG TPA: tyrosine-type recombinase/integrase [Pseudolabrys sp.]|nr:tyrosine-type recombinase/integrase [Pseudolabrys sp.]